MTRRIPRGGTLAPNSPDTPPTDGHRPDEYRRILALSGLGVGLGLLAGGGLARRGWSSETPYDIHDAVQPRFYGSDDAPLTVVEFFSITCHHCARFHREVFPVIEDNYILPGRIRMVWRDFPLDGLALRAAVIARCAPPDRYEDFIGAFMSTQEHWVRAPDALSELRKVAELGGMTRDVLDMCLNDQTIIDAVVQSRLEGQRDHGIQSTPSFLIHNERVSGFVEAQPFTRKIDEHLKRIEAEKNNT